MPDDTGAAGRRVGIETDNEPVQALYRSLGLKRQPMVMPEPCDQKTP